MCGNSSIVTTETCSGRVLRKDHSERGQPKHARDNPFSCHILRQYSSFCIEERAKQRVGDNCCAPKIIRILQKELSEGPFGNILRKQTREGAFTGFIGKMR